MSKFKIIGHIALYVVIALLIGYIVYVFKAI